MEATVEIFAVMGLPVWILICQVFMDKMDEIINVTAYHEKTASG